MQYTYTTNTDEEAALDLELAKANGQLAGQNQPLLDKQGLFALFVSQKLQPLAQQVLLARASPLVEHFLKSDEATRTQLLSATKVIP